jgi:signal transduction histidine kinase
MRLADFIEHNIEAIVSEAERFAAGQLPAAAHLDSEALRDHIPMMLQAIAADLRTHQTPDDALRKSLGERDGASETAAQTHALLRAKGGFGIEQMVAEYRALRACVLRLWMATHPPLDENALGDMVRFNEAIDQGIAESVASFTIEIDRWRQVFLGVLGHDLRGPLNSLILTTELLSRMGTREPLNDYTERLLRSGKRMKNLLDDLLDYNRSSLGLGIHIKRAPTDLAAACAEEVEILRSSLPGQQIDFMAQGLLHGDYDASRLREVIDNLVRNAAKYALQGPIRVRLTGDAQEVSLSVENAGEPMTPKQFASFFEPLRRGNRPSASEHDERASLGLGLFIVREIARAHGGEVHAESIQGMTVFRVDLPVSLPH